jgi:hypothetical protein
MLQFLSSASKIQLTITCACLQGKQQINVKSDASSKKPNTSKETDDSSLNAPKKSIPFALYSALLLLFLTAIATAAFILLGVALFASSFLSIAASWKDPWLFLKDRCCLWMLDSPFTAGVKALG